ncbi:hypothetical protein DAPPUDRAFT_251812 [Daphnia pulex]|uniref:RIH domain-containing protein n=1 Tax=Daphnia pulex TaxID=6669 RepID=E9H163_DAPPU|nr:hypothetical protein DAPPUDRAFT_251812 [Daphnia pulex]|eukprot:EFX74576.1 hypothetical protein DAPPUDRAFT_251812 [Daphnia pulex]
MNRLCVQPVLSTTSSVGSGKGSDSGGSVSGTGGGSLGGGLRPRKHEQRLLRNMGVHTVVLDLLQIPYDRKEDVRMNELMRLAHEFLQNFCRGNQPNQVLFHKHLELFLTPGALKSQTVCAIFQDNAQLCSELSDKVVQHFVHCIETHGRHVEYLDFLRFGRTLNTNQSQSSGTADQGSSRPSGASLDQDARMRIQLLSRHIENMQRICRSHLEMTRHRRQKILRILEDLREQIRYLQVCVRDSLDLVSRLRTNPVTPTGTSGPSSLVDRPHSSQRQSTDALAANREAGGTAGSSNSGPASLKAIPSSTAADQWSWDHELIRPFSAADSPIICLAVCVELDSNITAMNRDSDAILLPEETPDIPSGD